MRKNEQILPTHFYSPAYLPSPAQTGMGPPFLKFSEKKKESEPDGRITLTWGGGAHTQGQNGGAIRAVRYEAGIQTQGSARAGHARGVST